MNIFFLEYRDPLFGLIVFFVIIFIVSFLSYWWGKYKNQKDTKTLDRFLKKFHSLPKEDELKTLINQAQLSEKSWLLLASAYYKNGDYEKSIEIYNELLKVYHSKETMFLLGQTYFKAGFLERSKIIFLEILKHNPRTPQALKYLLLIYEYLRDYNSAMQVLEPLDILQEEIKLDSIYLKTLALLNDLTVPIEQKAKQLIKEYNKHRVLTYLIFDYLFRVNPKLAWENLPDDKLELLTDIFWYLDKSSLDFDIISKHNYLRELYCARGDLPVSLLSKKGSDIFEFDLLIKLGKDSNATLNFEYICDECKQSYPFAFKRCSNCYSIDTQRVEFTLTKNYHKDFSEENNSFQ